MQRAGDSSARETDDESHHASDSEDRSQGTLPDTMTDFIRNLQYTDAWLKGKAWESHTDHIISQGVYRGK